MQSNREHFASCDLLSSSFVKNPYPTFADLRHRAPVYWSEQIQAWLVTGYDDVVACLANPLVSADRITPRICQMPNAMRDRFDVLARMLAMWPLMLDKPAHSRLRLLVNQALTPSIVHSFLPRIHYVVTELIDAAKKAGGMEAISDFAAPFPLNVVSEIIGIPKEGRTLLKRSAVDIVNFFGSPPPQYVERAEKASRSTQEANEYLRRILRCRRRVPKQDLISSLAFAEHEGDCLSEEEILATCQMMVFAGFETTTNLIGNGLLALLTHSGERSNLGQDPSALKGAIQEILRFDAPVQRLSRVAKADFDFHGTTIRAGDLMFLMVASANRDETRFKDPDRFDIGREAGGHLSFGHSIHTCPGNTLAQLEAKIAYGELFRRFPRLSLVDDEPRWQANLSVRALERMPISFH